MKSFYIIVDDPIIAKLISIDNKKCSTVEDVKNEYATLMNIEPSSITITNFPKETQINSFKSHTEFKLSFKNRCKDITFQLPNGKLITIPNSYKMNFDDIIKHFEQKRIHFSPSCIDNNLHFMISGHEISYEKYPFFAVQQGSSVEVQLIEKFVRIEYSGHEFYFKENEKVDDARKFIIIFLKEIEFPTQIHIQHNQNLKDLRYDYKIKSDEEYNIKVPFIFSLRHILNKSVYSIQKMDLSATVSDVQQRLKIIFCDNNELNPENISIYDNSNQIITDKNVYIRKIMDKENSRIYFDINTNEINKSDTNIPKKEENSSVVNQTEINSPSKPKFTLEGPNLTSMESSNSKSHNLDSHFDEKIQILSSKSDNVDSNKLLIDVNFVFDENQFSPFTEKVDINTTIGTLDQQISDKFKITTKIIIEYKDGNNKTAIDHDMTIKDVIDDIKEESEKGKFKNILYIKITHIPKQKKKIKTSLFKPKTKPVLELESNEMSNRSFEEKKKKDINSDQLNEIPKNHPEDSNKTASSSKKQIYTFEFKKKEKRLQLLKDSFLIDNEDEIKQKFEIDLSEKIDFFVFNDEENDEKLDDNLKMESLHNNKIIVRIRTSPAESKSKSKIEIKKKNKENKFKIYYQTNLDNKIMETELEKGTNIKQFKELIAEENDVENLANIKVIFAGKDLLNDIVLDELNVGDTVLFIYIRTTQDIFLMTAKALKIGNDS